MRRFSACLIALLTLAATILLYGHKAAIAAPAAARAQSALPANTPKVPDIAPGRPATQPPKVTKPTPPATTWSTAEIRAAQLKCKALLATIKARTEPLAPIRKGACGNPAPVRVLSVGSNPVVAITPPPTLNCAMVVALHNWMTTRVQPLARRHLGGPIVTIRNVASYTCRNRYGRASGKLSEHARLNALDIASFRTQAGINVSLLPGWGPIARVAHERALAAKRAAEKAAQKAATAKVKLSEASKVGPSSPNSGKLRGPGKHTSRPTRAVSSGKRPAPQFASTKQTVWSAKIVAPTLRQGKHKPDTSRGASTPSPASIFLKRTHTAACGVFSTVLGPEANNAHKDHFHLDLATRKWKNYCQ